MEWVDTKTTAHANRPASSKIALFSKKSSLYILLGYVIFRHVALALATQAGAKHMNYIIIMIMIIRYILCLSCSFLYVECIRRNVYGGS